MPDAKDPTTDAARPGPQTTDDAGRSPKTPAGQPPAPNPGQIDIGTGYTVLTGGQDVQQPGYYFDEATRELRYWEKGQTLGGARQGHTWLYLTEDRDAGQDQLERLIRERGYGGSLEGMQIHDQ